MPKEIMQDIFRIEVPLPKNPLRTLNSYLVRGEERSLLIDTGFRMPECRAALSEGLTALGVRRETLDVVATHIHSDHIGLAPEFADPNGTIYVGQGDFCWLTTEENAAYWREMDERFLRMGFPKEGLEALLDTNPAKNNGPVLDLPQYAVAREGDCLSVGNYRLQVLEAPGHTPGMICLYIEEEALLFCSDHILYDITPNITMWPNMDDALGSYLDSLSRFEKLKVRRGLPAHREEGDYYARIRSLREHHDQRIHETLQVVAAHPGLHTYDIAGHMTWSIRAKNWAEFPLIQKWFAVGEAQSHLDYLCRQNRITVVEREGFLVYEAIV